jgi:hypothetical protein
MPVPVAMQSKAWVCGRSPAEIVGSYPAGAWMSVCCECCVLSGRGLCDELTHSSRGVLPTVVCRCVWSKNLVNEEALAHWGTHDVAGRRPATSSVRYTTSCNTQSSAPEDGKNNFPKHVELNGIINKPLLLHLVGLYYLYQWCTVKQISDNEIYLLIKNIKSGLWRVVKRLSLYTGRTVPKG